jgi:protein farnesyltransferase subunit beta
MRLEGGFQGRPNKLVDGCYSFWIGAVFPRLPAPAPQAWYSTDALQEYILLCCQAPAGGLRDKPSKGRDFYHTCYCLSGLASAQHGGGTRPAKVHNAANLLLPTDPVHNIGAAKVRVVGVVLGSRCVWPVLTLVCRPGCAAGGLPVRSPLKKIMYKSQWLLLR